MMMYSLKMRASQSKSGSSQHISGAERIINENEINLNVEAFISRAMNHSKGQPDFINLKIEAVTQDEIQYVDALPVKTVEVLNAETGQEIILKYLEQIGITNGSAIMKMFSQTYNMRGAMLLDVDTLERLEPNHERGLRATYMDAVHNSANKVEDTKNHFAEAIVLASKVINAPNIIGEICVSDDPNYVTGYVAALSIGYVRITKLKDMGSPDGGRIFLYRGDHDKVKDCINYLEHQKVLVRNVPNNPATQNKNAETKNIVTNCSIVDKNNFLMETINNLKQNNLYRTMNVIESAQDSHVAIDGHDFIMMASNNYLGLTADSRIKVAAMDAIERYGTGSGGSRLTTGNFTLHKELEDDLSKFKHTERAILFNTGYMANVGTISALGRSGTVIFSDELNHASIIDGCRLSRAQVVIYRHNDMKDLENNIKKIAPSNGLIVTDAVFSMDGDIANLPAIMELTKKYNLLVMVDEAHSTGVIGGTGHGIVEHFGLKSNPDVLMGTLSKSLASEGGYVCGSQTLIDYLRNKARSFIFSTSLAPATIAAAKAALNVLNTEPERVKRLHYNIEYFCKHLNHYGINTNTESAIVPIIIGEEERALKIASELYNKGIYISAIRYPTVAKGQARLRAAIMATHTEDDLNTVAEKINRTIKP
ncbi:MAG: 8-amino-7-oxononanoate synthase [Selenomonadaceae bacterium]|nr:8-amino-7-oxononanoate synthase [Selenomonadaceae bacterium]